MTVGVRLALIGALLSLPMLWFVFFGGLRGDDTDLNAARAQIESQTLLLEELQLAAENVLEPTEEQTSFTADFEEQLFVLWDEEVVERIVACGNLAVEQRAESEAALEEVESVEEGAETVNDPETQALTEETDESLKEEEELDCDDFPIDVDAPPILFFNLEEMFKRQNTLHLLRFFLKLVDDYPGDITLTEYEASGEPAEPSPLEGVEQTGATVRVTGRTFNDLLAFGVWLDERPDLILQEMSISWPEELPRIPDEDVSTMTLIKEIGGEDPWPTPSAEYSFSWYRSQIVLDRATTDTASEE